MKEDFVFSRRNRIKHTSQFKLIFRKGNKLSGFYYTAFFILKSKGDSRLGISIPRRIGKAVFRNRQKRVIREVFRQQRTNFKCPIDLVLVLNRTPDSSQAPRIELDRIFLWLKSLTCYID